MFAASMFPLGAVVLRRLIVICALALSTGAVAAPGDLDTSFGIGGRGFAAIPGTDSVYGEAIALAPGGKLVAAGRCVVFATLTTHFCVIRTTANGFFDPEFFGTGYKKIFANDGDTEIPRAVTVQPDGKIVIAGQCGPEAAPTHTCVVRLLEDGSADDGFGTSGKVKFNFGAGGSQDARAVTVLPDGKLLLGGHCAGSSIATVGPCVMRLNANGTVDTTFGSAGRTLVRINLEEQLTSMLVRPDGKIVFAFQSNSAFPPAAETPFVNVAQLSANGTLDTAFGVSGIRGITVATTNKLPRMALQPDGKIVVAFVCDNGQCGKRLDAAGNVDASFNYPNGVPVGMPIDAGEYGLKPLLQSDGKILWIGSVVPVAPGSGTLGFYAMRSLDTGTLDAAYTGGGAKTMLSSEDRANDALILPDDKVLLVGTCYTGSSFQLCIARLQAGPFGARNCSMDIDGDGRVLPTTDALILARASLGLAGAAVLNGIATTGPRNTWPFIRDYLINQCGMSNLAP